MFARRSPLARRLPRRVSTCVTLRPGPARRDRAARRPSPPGGPEAGLGARRLGGRLARVRAAGIEWLHRLYGQNAGSIQHLPRCLPSALSGKEMRCLVPRDLIVYFACCL
jgi:hypothetical protein